MTALHGKLRRLARRQFAFGLAAAAGWGLVAAAAIVLAMAWLDLFWELSPEMRIAGLILGAVGAAIVLVAVVWSAIRAGRLQTLARRLDRAAEAHGEICSGVDLLLGQYRPDQPAISAGLGAIAVRRATHLAAPVPAHRAVPARPLLWAFGGCAVMALIPLALAVWSSRLVETQWWRLVDPYGDHPPYSRVIFVVEPGDVRVVYGRGFDVHVRTEGGAAERLDLVLMADDGAQETLPMFPESDGDWRATVASVQSPGRYLVRSRDGRSRKYRLDVQTVPVIESVRFHIVPPPYTHLPPYDGPLPAGGIAGLPGTEVGVIAQSNRPLAGGRLEYPGSEDARPSKTQGVSPSLMVGTSPYEVRGRFVLRQAGAIALSVTDVDGQASDAPFTAAVTLLIDEPPFVRLLEPPPLSYASPEAILPVTVAAEDDYGISRLQLFRSLNDSRSLAFELPRPRPEPTRQFETTPLPLAAFGLQPGDEIKLFARVEDNDPAGAKGAESTVAVIHIIAQAELDRLMHVQRGLEMLRSKYQAAQRRMESLAEDVDRLGKKARDPSKQDEVKDELKKLAEKMRREAEALRKLAERKLDYDLDEALTPHLQRLSREVEAAATEAERLAGQSLSAAELAEGLDRLKDRLDREQQAASKKTVQPLESLALVVPLFEDASRFRILAQKQRSLADRSKSLDGQERPADSSAKSRLRDYQEEQERLRAALAKLLDDIEEHAAKLPDQPEFEELKSSALDFAQRVRMSGADEAMVSAEDGFRDFSGTRGHAGAKKAADLLEKFIEKSDGIGSECEGCLRFKVGLGVGLGNTLGQLLADAGLSMGQGDGSGLGSGTGGSSARRDGLENVGLYGSRDTQSSSAASGGGLGRPSAGVSTPRAFGPTAPGRPAPGAAPGTAMGAVEALVPSAYRKRVAEYFQRIADETGKK